MRHYEGHVVLVYSKDRITGKKPKLWPDILLLMKENDLIFTQGKQISLYYLQFSLGKEMSLSFRKLPEFSYRLSLCNYS